MAILRFKSVKDSGVGELKSKLQELNLELMKLNFQRASKSVSNPGKIGEIRRSIAKILTVMSLKGKEQRAELKAGKVGKEGKSAGKVQKQSQRAQEKKGAVQKQTQDKRNKLLGKVLKK